MRFQETGSCTGVTPTEWDTNLLRCLVRGLYDKEITLELSLSDSRVRNILSALYVKLGVSGRALAAAYAVEHRLI